ncbi:MAG: TatD family hydrolase [Cytophagaceae bacterium]|jgi:TatD DNase family protein|nr:TatD family hydrolase [Cytophagaceae bacterium]
MIDTHSHIYLDIFDGDRSLVVNRAVEAGITRILLPNIDSQSITALYQAERDYPETCKVLMGLHPTSVKKDYKKELSIIEKQLSVRSFAGIGEIGFDLYWDTTFRKEQVDALVTQLTWAAEMNLPVAIHTRNAFPDIFDVFAKIYDHRLRGVFHSFSGTLNDARQILKMPNFYLGINGTVTYKNSNLPNILLSTGYERLLLETDAPYLPPVPHRGKRNEPAYMLNTANKVAEIFAVSRQTVDEITTDNANKLFM